MVPDKLESIAALNQMRIDGAVFLKPERVLSIDKFAETVLFVVVSLVTSYLTDNDC